MPFNPGRPPIGKPDRRAFSFEDFDALPPAVRRTLDFSDYRWSTHSVKKILKEAGEGAAIAAIKKADDKARARAYEILEGTLELKEFGL